MNAGPNTYAYVDDNPLRYTDIFGLEVTCEWIATRYYDKVIPKLLQPELGYWRKVCFPAPVPTGGFPPPVPKRMPGFPSPAGMAFEKKCVEEWIVTQEAKYGQDIEKWMSGYMKCTDSCTGKVKNHWGVDRPADNPPKIN